MGGSSKPATQTTNSSQTQQTSPWAPANPALQGMITSAQQAYANTPKTPTYTGPNSDQLTAANLLKTLAPGTGAGAQAVLDNAQKTASGYYLNNNPFTSQNPNVQSVIDASIIPLRKQLDSNVLSIGDAAKLAGAYGGDRQDLLKATALGQFNDSAMATGANLNYQAWNDQQQRAMQEYNLERQNQMGAAQLFQQGNALRLTPAQLLGAVGDTESQQQLAVNQSALDAPWAGLDRLSQVLGTVAPYSTTTGTGTSTTVGTPAKGSQFAGATSGALGGASAGAAFGPWGAGIGAVLGGLGGLFG